MDALLSMKMGAEETLCSYNQISEDNKKIAVSTFQLGLLEDSELQESLTMRPSEDIRQLMRRIEEYKWLKDNRQQNKGKAPIISHLRQGGF